MAPNTIGEQPLNEDCLIQFANVRIKDLETTKKKLSKLSLDGKEKLLVISDFDLTISKYHDENGEQTWNTHGVFDHCYSAKAPDVREKMAILRKKFFPFEHSTELTKEEKIPYMEEWWRTSHNNIVEGGYDFAWIKENVENGRILLRDGTGDLMSKLESTAVPLIVFSAGLANIIRLKFHHEFGREFQNTKVVGNEMLFSKEGVITSFRGPVIHAYNKTAAVIETNAEIMELIGYRNNVILMGDSLGDVEMHKGLKNVDCVLKIGFLNTQAEKFLDHYMDAYDIVILDDQTMNVPMAVFYEILSSGDKNNITI